jgi:hypothetical protein
MAPSVYKIPNRSVLGRDLDTIMGLYGNDLTKKITTYIKKQITQDNPQYRNIANGDIIDIESESHYRNNGIFMWNGKKVVELYTDYDDYGSVPPEIEIADDNDFTPTSWLDLIDHNSVIWFSPEIRSRMEFERGGPRDVHYYDNFPIDNEVWKFVYSPDDDRLLPEHQINNINGYLKQKLMQNKCVFEVQNIRTREISVRVTDIVHGKVRRSRGNTSRSNRTAPVAPPEAPAAPPPPAPPVPPQLDRENIARIQRELEEARNRVVQLEQELARAILIGGSKKKKMNN